MLEPRIVFEDEALLVLDKPAGLVVNKAETLKELTLQDFLEKYFHLSGEPGGGRGVGDRAGIVHRLDRETSGIILVAKTEEAFLNLQKQFKERQVQKKYLVLVHGKVLPLSGKIKAAIARSPFDRKKFGVFLGGREAETDYRVCEIRVRQSRQNKEYFSFLEVEPKTGRTHQIRVHLKYLGYSVVGDEKYAGRKTARRDREWCPRQFLHAACLTFTHPITGEKVVFNLSLPPDLQKAFASLSRED